MPADNFIVRNLFPASATDEMLRFQKGVAENGGRGGHSYEVGGRHGGPDLGEERAVIDLGGVSDGVGKKGRGGTDA